VSIRSRKKETVLMRDTIAVAGEVAEKKEAA
jgi:hypothetical protein